MRGVGAAAQDRGIAGLQAERAGIGGHIRPAFIDDADDAERHPHALDGQAVRPRPGFGDVADRVGERAHGLDAGGDTFDLGGVEREAVEQRTGHAVALGLGNVLGVGGENLGLLRADRRRHGVERTVFLRCRRLRQNLGGGARAAADLGHPFSQVGSGEIAGSLDALQRRGHCVVVSPVSCWMLGVLS